MHIIEGSSSEKWRQSECAKHEKEMIRLLCRALQEAVEEELGYRALRFSRTHLVVVICAVSLPPSGLPPEGASLCSPAYAGEEVQTSSGMRCKPIVGCCSA